MLFGLNGSLSLNGSNPENGSMFAVVDENLSKLFLFNPLIDVVEAKEFEKIFEPKF